MPNEYDEWAVAEEDGAIALGARDFWNGKSYDANPYPAGDPLRGYWFTGWDNAKSDYEWD